MATPLRYLNRTLVTIAQQGTTNGIIERRAKQIAHEIGASTVVIQRGSREKGVSWHFGWRNERGMKMLDLKIFGTRGSVYTALGNFHDGYLAARHMHGLDA